MVLGGLGTLVSAGGYGGYGDYLVCHPIDTFEQDTPGGGSSAVAKAWLAGGESCYTDTPTMAGLNFFGYRDVYVKKTNDEGSYLNANVGGGQFEGGARSRVSGIFRLAYSLVDTATCGTPSDTVFPTGVDLCKGAKPWDCFIRYKRINDHDTNLTVSLYTDGDSCQKTAQLSASAIDKQSEEVNMQDLLSSGSCTHGDITGLQFEFQDGLEHDVAISDLEVCFPKPRKCCGGCGCGCGCGCGHGHGHGHGHY